jgi:hypothetical protein
MRAPCRLLRREHASARARWSLPTDSGRGSTTPPRATPFGILQMFFGKQEIRRRRSEESSGFRTRALDTDGHASFFGTLESSNRVSSTTKRHSSCSPCSSSSSKRLPTSSSSCISSSSSRHFRSICGSTSNHCGVWISNCRGSFSKGHPSRSKCDDLRAPRGRNRLEAVPTRLRCLLAGSNGHHSSLNRRHSS